RPHEESARGGIRTHTLLAEQALLRRRRLPVPTPGRVDLASDATAVRAPTAPGTRPPFGAGRRRTRTRANSPVRARPRGSSRGSPGRRRRAWARARAAPAGRRPPPARPPGAG